MEIRMFDKLILLLIAVVLFSCSYAPERPSNMNPEAQWIGGADGGYWIIVDNIINDTTFKASIFDEVTGELITSSDFSTSDKKVKLSNTSIKDLYPKFNFVSESDIQMEEKGETISFKKRIITEYQAKNINVNDTLIRLFKSINLKEIRKIKTSVTSTFLSKEGCMHYSPPLSIKDGYYEVVLLINRNCPTDESMFAAHYTFVGQKLPKTFDDLTDSLVNIIIFTPEIKITPYLTVGNSIDSVISILGKPVSEIKKDEDDILFYNQKEIILAVKAKNKEIQIVEIGRYKTSDYSLEEIEKRILDDFKQDRK